MIKDSNRRAYIKYRKYLRHNKEFSEILEVILDQVENKWGEGKVFPFFSDLEHFIDVYDLDVFELLVSYFTKLNDINLKIIDYSKSKEARISYKKIIKLEIYFDHTESVHG